MLGVLLEWQNCVSDSEDSLPTKGNIASVFPKIAHIATYNIAGNIGGE